MLEEKFLSLYDYLERIAREKETKDALNAIDKEYNYKLEQAKGNTSATINENVDDKP